MPTSTDMGWLHMAVPWIPQFWQEDAVLQNRRATQFQDAVSHLSPWGRAVRENATISPSDALTAIMQHIPATLREKIVPPALNIKVLAPICLLFFPTTFKS